MKPIRISVVAQSYRDFSSFHEKLEEASRWMEIAANQGTDLVVFPEFMNFYRGDGPGHPNPLSNAEAALEDWKVDTQVLFHSARRLGVDFVLPLMIRDGECLRNCFFMITSSGEVLGRYDKMQPTQEELNEGVRPGAPTIIHWRGLRVGGAICFDTNFDEVFRSQAALGADLFIVPSLWPGGSFLNAYAVRYAAPIALAYPAWSKVIDVDGHALVEGGYRSETLRFGFGSPVYTCEINWNRVILHADGNAGKIGDVERKFGRAIRTRFYQEDSRFIIESVDKELDIAEVIREFELERIQDYYRRFQLWR